MFVNRVFLSNETLRGLSNRTNARVVFKKRGKDGEGSMMSQEIEVLDKAEFPISIIARF